MKKKVRVFTTPVIAGKFKGKKIAIPAVKSTRSSKAILRESLFNTLQFDIVGKNFVEVFAGSGSVAIEAVSRGAEHAWCIEKNREVYGILKENVRQITPGKITAVAGDSFEEFAGVYAEALLAGKGIYFYLDPPFSIREGMEEIYEKTMSLMERINPELCEMVIIEHMTSLDIPKHVGSLEFFRKKRFGKSSLSYYRPVRSHEK
jgi:16S rRNA (guanine(966)-N(2))-methyltransferase RsmD